MENLLNEEVLRIKEIMGIDTFVISEQEQLIKKLYSSSDEFASTFDNFIRSSYGTQGIDNFDDLIKQFDSFKGRAGNRASTLEDFMPGFTKAFLSNIQSTPQFAKNFRKTVITNAIGTDGQNILVAFKNNVEGADVALTQKVIDNYEAAKKTINTGNKEMDIELQGIIDESPLYKKAKEKMNLETEKSKSFTSGEKEGFEAGERQGFESGKVKGREELAAEEVDQANRIIDAARQQSDFFGKIRLKFKNPQKFYDSFKAKGLTDKEIIEEIAKKYSGSPISIRKTFESIFSFLSKYKWTSLSIGIAIGIGSILYAFFDMITLYYKGNYSPKVEDNASVITGYDKLDETQRLFVLSFLKKQIENKQVNSFIPNKENGGITIVYSDTKTQALTGEEMLKLMGQQAEEEVKKLDLNNLGGSSSSSSSSVQYETEDATDNEKAKVVEKLNKTGEGYGTDDYPYIKKIKGKTNEFEYEKSNGTKIIVTVD